MLKKLFIKNYKNTDDPEVRNQYGKVAGVFGIFTNIILGIIKLIIGLISLFSDDSKTFSLCLSGSIFFFFVLIFYYRLDRYVARCCLLRVIKIYCNVIYGNFRRHNLVRDT